MSRGQRRDPSHRRAVALQAALTLLVSLVSLVVIGWAPASAQAQSVGETAIGAVHAHRNDKTYKTLTFVQETQFADGRSETWYESLKTPGLLRIDIAPGDTNARVLLFRNDSVYQGGTKRAIAGRPYVHPLMVLFTDIATSDPQVTIAKVRQMGVDLSRSRADVFRGKPVTVIGAAVGDTTSTQFWIENERQLVVRLIERERRAGAGTNDTQVLSFTRAGAGWVESEIVFYSAGKLTQRELYNDVRTDVPLDDAIFQPVLASVPQWIAARRKP